MRYPDFHIAPTKTKKNHIEDDAKCTIGHVQGRIVTKEATQKSKSTGVPVNVHTHTMTAQNI